MPTVAGMANHAVQASGYELVVLPNKPPRRLGLEVKRTQPQY